MAFAGWFCTTGGMVLAEQTENWLPVVGYEGLYEVSDLGRVRTLHGKHQGRIMTPTITARGYLRVGIRKNRVRQHFAVHRIVLAAFVGPRPEKNECDHLNNVKTDNRLCNLEYVTSSENKLRAYKTGARMPAVGSKHGMSKLTEDDVLRIKDLLSKIESGELMLSRREISTRFNVSDGCIKDIQAGRLWQHVHFPNTQGN